MQQFIRHLFIPHHKNNHRAKLLHNSSIFFLVMFLFATSLTLTTLKHNNPQVLGISYSISDSELLTLVNKERQAKGLSPLTMNATLSTAAHAKADDMLAKDYWAHFAPDGGTPWNFIKQSGYTYVYAGENLAKGFTNSQDVVNAWMNSPTHRDNLLSDKYHDMGFAIVQGDLVGEDTVLVVQMFGSTPESAYDTTTNQLVDEPSTPPSVAAPTPLPTFRARSTDLQFTQGFLGTQEKAKSPLERIAPAAFFAQPLVDISFTSRIIALVVLGIFVLALLLDIFVVRKKHIPRLVGHNIDHVVLIVLFVLFIVFGSQGGIL